MTETQTAAAPPAAPRTAHRWPIALVRVLAIVILLQVLLQAALAGGFITGNLDMVTVHSINGSLLITTVMALGVAAVLLIWPGRGPWWPLVFTFVFWWLCAAQVAFGFARQIGLHIPLGVTIMMLISGFTWWSLAYRPGTRRVPA